MTPQGGARAGGYDVDWQRAWLAPYRADGEAVCDALALGAGLPQALNTMSRSRAIELAAGALRFVPHTELPPDEAYETFIHRSACVPTRDNLHDFFNGLVWLRFPALKRRLNELQAEAIRQAGVGATRGALRDALTVFDENAALLQAPPALAEALRRRDWTTLFTTQRSLWAQASLTLFGHALLNKLVEPRKAITAHVWLVAPSGDLQTALLDDLAAARLATKPFLPLPVLGVPGWWAPNEVPDFYADPSVFRPHPHPE